MFFVIFLCAASLVFSSSAQSPRIVGGKFVTDRSKFPYQVSLQSQGEHFCGGTIIDKQHVLTAAHCVVNDVGKVADFSSWTVVAGGLNIFYDSKNIMYKVKNVFMHEAYFVNNDFIKNDIAVLRISGSFAPFSAGVNVAKLGVATPKAGALCVASGWGTLEWLGDVSADLQTVTVPSIAFADCNKMYNNTLDAKVMCAGVADKDSCQGDSGGPLLCDNLLAGVVSYGMRCGVDQFPGIYTDVSKFVDWINVQTTKSGGSAVKSTLSMGLVVAVGIIGLLF